MATTLNYITDPFTGKQIQSQDPNADGYQNSLYYQRAQNTIAAADKAAADKAAAAAQQAAYLQQQQQAAIDKAAADAAAAAKAVTDAAALKQQQADAAAALAKQAQAATITDPISGKQYQSVDKNSPNYTDAGTYNNTQNLIAKAAQASTFNTGTLGPITNQTQPVTASNGITYYPTQQGWVQSTYQTNPGYADATNLAKLQTAQNQFAKTYVDPASYVDASTLDPSILKTAGITPTAYQQHQVVQTTNINAPGYVSPVALTQYQTQTQKLHDTAAAQAAFKAPDPSIITPTTDPNQIQHITSPDGSTTYVGVPADPIKGTPAQWYKTTDNGTTYTPASGGTAVNGQDLNNLIGSVQSSITQNNYQQHLASIPYQTIGSTRFQTTDPYAPGYQAPDAVARIQANYTQQQQQYQASLPYTTVGTSRFQTVDASAPNYIAPDKLTAEQKTANDKTLNGVTYDYQHFYDPTSGKVMQSQYPDMPNYVAPTDFGAAATKAGYTSQMSGYSLDSYKQFQATQQADQAANALQQANNAPSVGGIPTPAAVSGYTNLPKVSPTSLPMVDSSTNTTYYPATNGTWQQNSNPNAPGYVAPGQLQMQVPPLSADSKPFVGPDGQTYYPMHQVNGQGNDGWYSAAQDPNIAKTYDTNARLYQTQQATFVDPSAYFKSPSPGVSGAGGININGQTNMVQTTNPNAPGYIASSVLADAKQQQTQQQQYQQIINPPKSDDIFAQFDKFVNKTVGWDNIAAVAGSIVGGPFGAALAKATAEAVQGKTPGQILKDAALTFAMSYGSAALGDALGGAVSDATSQAVSNGVLDSGTLGDALGELNDSVGTQVTDTLAPDLVNNYAPDLPTVEAPTPTPETPVVPEPTAPIEGGTNIPEPTGPVAPGEATTPVSEGPQLPNGPQAPTNINSTGISDSAPGTIYTDANGTQEIVLDSGKTVNYQDYQAAQASGQPVSVDGQMTTGGRVTVDLQTSPVEPPGGWGSQPNPVSPTLPELPSGPSLPDVPSAGDLPDVIVTASRDLGLTTTQIIALGGVAAATAAVAAMGSGGAAAAADAAIANPAPVTPGGPTPGPTPVEPTPPTTQPPGPPTTQPPGPVTPEPVPPGPPTTQPPGPVTPEPVPPGGPTTPGPVTPEPVPPTPVEPAPVTPQPPGPVTPEPTPPTPPNQPAPVYDYSTPYEGPPIQDESVLSRFLSGTITYGDILKGIAIGMFAPTVLNLLGVYGGPSAPQKNGYGPLAPIQWGTLEGGLTNPGLNPGYLTSQTPYYQTTDPVQSQYYWGQHPYIKTLSDIGQWHNAPEAPAVPFGLQHQRTPFDVNQFIASTIGTPQYQQAATGSSGQYPATYAPATSYTGSPVAPVATPQVAPAIQPQQMNTTYTPQNLQTYMPTAPVVPKVNMNFAPVTVPTTLPAWAPGQWDLTQPVTPYGTTPAPVKA